MIKLLLPFAAWLPLSAAVLALDGSAAPAKNALRPTHILATDWGLTLKADGTGFYNDLAVMLFAPEIGSVNYEILPYRRAKRHFFEDAGACLYPNSIEYLTTIGDISDPDQFIGYDQAVLARMHVFAAPGKPAPKQPSDLDDKRVAYAMGGKVPVKLAGARAFFIAVADEVDKAEMLLGGRVDMITAAMPDAKFVFDQLGQPLAPYDPNFLLEGSGLGIVCHRTPENEIFVENFSRYVTQMRKNGDLPRFLHKNGLDPAQYLPKD